MRHEILDQGGHARTIPVGIGEFGKRLGVGGCIAGIGQYLIDQAFHHLAVLNLTARIHVVAILMACAGEHERLHAIEGLLARTNGDLVSTCNDVLQGHCNGNVHINTAASIDEVLEGDEAQIEIVLGGHTGELGHLVRKRRDAALAIRVVDLLGLAIHVRSGIARDGDDADVVGRRIDAHQHDGVGPAQTISEHLLADVHGSRTGIVAHHQHVEGFGFLLDFHRGLFRLGKLLLLGSRRAARTARKREAQCRQAEHPGKQLLHLGHIPLLEGSDIRTDNTIARLPPP